MPDFRRFASAAMISMMSATVVLSFDDLGDHAAVPHDADPVREPEHLLQLGGDVDDGHALLGQRGDQALDLRLGADVDAAGRFVKDQQLAVG